MFTFLRMCIVYEMQKLYLTLASYGCCPPCFNHKKMTWSWLLYQGRRYDNNVIRRVNHLSQTKLNYHYCKDKLAFLNLYRFVNYLLSQKSNVQLLQDAYLKTGIHGMIKEILCLYDKKIRHQIYRMIISRL